MLASLQELALAYLRRDVAATVPFWRMVATSVDELRRRAETVASVTGATALATEAVPGAGSAPGVTIPSFGVDLAGDRTAALRAHDPPVIARARDGRTILDLRAVEPTDDEVIVDALRCG